ncbi:MAG: TOBE domain-containing protein, partial [Actinobacteria bacterium]|nr:TOBE domain-containing protein [Actinomycetota bacterium]
FVADFLGFRTVVDVMVSSGVADAGPFGRIPVTGVSDGPAIAVIRPDALAIDPAGHLDAVVQTVAFRGSHCLVTLRLGTVVAEAQERRAPPLGARVRLSLDPNGVVVLGSETPPI